MRQHGRKSRDARRSFNAPGWISINGAFGVKKCTVMNMSTSGVEIRVDRPENIANNFNLSFSPTDRGGKRCEVVWRKASTMGAKFMP
jgi:hypothetical protein